MKFVTIPWLTFVTLLYTIAEQILQLSIIQARRAQPALRLQRPLQRIQSCAL
jgi:hypothetical protein